MTKWIKIKEEELALILIYSRKYLESQIIGTKIQDMIKLSQYVKINEKKIGIEIS